VTSMSTCSERLGKHTSGSYQQRIHKDWLPSRTSNRDRGTRDLEVGPLNHSPALASSVRISASEPQASAWRGPSAGVVRIILSLKQGSPVQTALEEGRDGPIIEVYYSPFEQPMRKLHHEQVPRVANISP
jgi:hypothetical protein